MMERVRLLALRNAGFVLACAALFAGFEFLIGMVVASLHLGSALETLLASLPPVMRLLLENVFAGDFSARGVLAFGWTHPIAQAAGAAVAVMLGSRAIAGACEDGTIEMALALPVTRRAHLAAHVVFALLALALVGTAGAAGTAVARQVHALQGIGDPALGRLALNWWVLQAAWLGVALAVSAWSREGSRASGLVFLLALASLLAEVIGRLLPAGKPVLPWTLYEYFQPRDILMRGVGVVRPVATLLAVATAGIAVAFARFERRDLP